MIYKIGGGNFYGAVSFEVSCEWANRMGGALFEAKNRRHTNLNNPYTFYYIKQGKFSIRKKVLSKVFEDKSPDSYHTRRSPVSRE